MQAKDIKNGNVVVVQNAPVIVENVSVQSPSARGGATLYKFRGRNLVTKNKVDFTMKGTESLDEADFQKRPVNMMYCDATDMHLLDQEDFSQFALNLDDIKEERKYIKEGLAGMFALIYNDECVGLQVPDTVELLVTECDPAVKGNSATSRTKPAKLETGLTISVPEYLKQGETVKIDTRTGDFLSRA